MATSFDPQAAIAEYVARHEAECAELHCAATDASLDMALNQIAFPVAVLGGALLLHKLGFWRKAYLFLTRCGDWPKRGAATFGAVAMALMVVVQSPLEYYNRVWLGKVDGNIIRCLGDDPRCPEPPTFLDKNLSFLADQLWWALGLCLAAAVLAPVAIWLRRHNPRIAVAVVGSAVFLWMITPNYEDWRETYPISQGPLYDDVAVIAERGGISMDRVLVGKKIHWLPNMHEARADWHDGETKAIMNQGMLNIFRANPRNRSYFKPFTAAEFRAVAAHEIAHLEKRHLEWRLVVFALVVMCFSVLAAGLAEKLAARKIETGDDDNVRHAIFWPSFLAAGFALYFVALPISINFHRVMENQADARGLELARDPDGAAELALRFARGKPLDWPRWYHTLYNTHPDSLTRITRAMEWKAQNTPDVWSATGWSGPVQERYGDEFIPHEGWSETGTETQDETE